MQVASIRVSLMSNKGSSPQRVRLAVYSAMSLVCLGMATHASKVSREYRQAEQLGLTSESPLKGGARELLSNLLAEYESRRCATDNRANLLCVVGVAHLGFIIQGGESLFGGMSWPYGLIYTVLAATAATISLYRNIEIALPVRRKRRERRGSTSNTMTWFWEVGTRRAEDYLASLRTLTTTELDQEITRQIVGIAKMLRHRYSQMVAAGKWLKASLAMTVTGAMLSAVLRSFSL